MGAKEEWFHPVTKTIAATPTLLVDESIFETRSVLIQSIAANTEACYIGGSDVTAANGLELVAGKSISLDVATAIYAIRVTANQDLRVVSNRRN